VVNYLGTLSGVSWLIISVFCQASNGKLNRYFVWRLVVNYLGILSGVSRLSRYLIGRLVVNYLGILSGVSLLSRYFIWRLVVNYLGILSGVLRWMILVFCQMCNEQLTYKGLQFTINCVRCVKDKMTMEQGFLQVFRFSLASKYSTLSCIYHSRIDKWTHKTLQFRRDVFWTHDEDDNSSSSNGCQELGSLPVVTCSCIQLSVTSHEWNYYLLSNRRLDSSWHRTSAHALSAALLAEDGEQSASLDTTEVRNASYSN
jgi:hypothetical protein